MDDGEEVLRSRDASPSLAALDLISSDLAAAVSSPFDSADHGNMSKSQSSDGLASTGALSVAVSPCRRYNSESSNDAPFFGFPSAPDKAEPGSVVASFRSSENVDALSRSCSSRTSHLIAECRRTKVSVCLQRLSRRVSATARHWEKSSETRSHRRKRSKKTDKHDSLDRRDSSSKAHNKNRGKNDHTKVKVSPETHHSTSKGDSTGKHRSSQKHDSSHSRRSHDSLLSHHSLSKDDSPRSNHRSAKHRKPESDTTEQVREKSPSKVAVLVFEQSLMGKESLSTDNSPTSKSSAGHYRTPKKRNGEKKKRSSDSRQLSTGPSEIVAQADGAGSDLNKSFSPRAAIVKPNRKLVRSTVQSAGVSELPAAPVVKLRRISSENIDQYIHPVGVEWSGSAQCVLSPENADGSEPHHSGSMQDSSSSVNLSNPTENNIASSTGQIELDAIASLHDADMNNLEAEDVEQELKIIEVTSLAGDKTCIFNSREQSTQDFNSIDISKTMPSSFDSTDIDDLVDDIENISAEEFELDVLDVSDVFLDDDSLAPGENDSATVDGTALSDKETEKRGFSIFVVNEKALETIATSLVADGSPFSSNTSHLETDNAEDPVSGGKEVAAVKCCEQVPPVSPPSKPPVTGVVVSTTSIRQISVVKSTYGKYRLTSADRTILDKCNVRHSVVRLRDVKYSKSLKRFYKKAARWLQKYNGSTHITKAPLDVSLGQVDVHDVRCSPVLKSQLPDLVSNVGGSRSATNDVKEMESGSKDVSKNDSKGTRVKSKTRTTDKKIPAPVLKDILPEEMAASVDTSRDFRIPKKRNDDKKNRGPQSSSPLRTTDYPKKSPSIPHQKYDKYNNPYSSRRPAESPQEREKRRLQRLQKVQSQLSSDSAVPRGTSVLESIMQTPNTPVNSKGDDRKQSHVKRPSSVNQNGRPLKVSRWSSPITTHGVSGEGAPVSSVYSRKPPSLPTSVHPSVSTPVHPSVSTSVHPSVSTLVHPSLSTPVHPSLSTPVHPSVSTSVLPSVSTSVNSRVGPTGSLSTYTQNEASVTMASSFMFVQHPSSTQPQSRWGAQRSVEGITTSGLDRWPQPPEETQVDCRMIEDVGEASADDHSEDAATSIMSSVPGAVGDRVSEPCKPASHSLDERLCVLMALNEFERSKAAVSGTKPTLPSSDKHETDPAPGASESHAEDAPTISSQTNDVSPGLRDSDEDEQVGQAYSPTMSPMELCDLKGIKPPKSSLKKSSVDCQETHDNTVVRYETHELTPTTTANTPEETHSNSKPQDSPTTTTGGFLGVSKSLKAKALLLTRHRKTDSPLVEQDSMNRGGSRYSDVDVVRSPTALPPTLHLQNSTTHRFHAISAQKSSETISVSRDIPEAFFNSSMTADETLSNSDALNLLRHKARSMLASGQIAHHHGQVVSSSPVGADPTKHVTETVARFAFPGGGVADSNVLHGTLAPAQGGVQNYGHALSRVSRSGSIGGPESFAIPPTGLQNVPLGMAGHAGGFRGSHEENLVPQDFQPWRGTAHGGIESRLNPQVEDFPTDDDSYYYQSPANGRFENGSAVRPWHPSDQVPFRGVADHSSVQPLRGVGRFVRPLLSTPAFRGEAPRAARERVLRPERGRGGFVAPHSCSASGDNGTICSASKSVGERYGERTLDTVITLAGTLTDAYTIVDEAKLWVRCNVCGISVYGLSSYQDHIYKQEHMDNWRHALANPLEDPPNMPLEGFGPPRVYQQDFSRDYPLYDNGASAGEVCFYQDPASDLMFASAPRAELAPRMVQPGVVPRSVRPGGPGTQYGRPMRPAGPPNNPGPDRMMRPGPGMMNAGPQGQRMMRPRMMRPGMNAPGMMRPGMNASGIMRPGMNASGMMRPGMNASGMMRPGMNAPGVMRPGMNLRGMPLQPGMRQMMRPGMRPQRMIGHPGTVMGRMPFGQHGYGGAPGGYFGKAEEAAEAGDGEYPQEEAAAYIERSHDPASVSFSSTIAKFIPPPMSGVGATVAAASPMHQAPPPAGSDMSQVLAKFGLGVSSAPTTAPPTPAVTTTAPSAPSVAEEVSLTDMLNSHKPPLASTPAVDDTATPAHTPVTFIDKYTDEALVGTEYVLMVEGDDDTSDYFICLMCSRRMEDEKEAIAHIMCPQHRVTYLDRFFPRAFSRLGYGLSSGLHPWTAATFVQLEIICKRIRSTLGCLPPGLVSHSKFVSEPLTLRKRIEDRQHFLESSRFNYTDLSNPFDGEPLTELERPRLIVGSLVLMTSTGASMPAAVGAKPGDKHPLQTKSSGQRTPVETGDKPIHSVDDLVLSLRDPDMENDVDVMRTKEVVLAEIDRWKKGVLEKEEAFKKKLESGDKKDTNSSSSIKVTDRKTSYFSAARDKARREGSTSDDGETGRDNRAGSRDRSASRGRQRTSRERSSEAGRQPPFKAARTSSRDHDRDRRSERNRYREDYSDDEVVDDFIPGVRRQHPNSRARGRGGFHQHGRGRQDDERFRWRSDKARRRSRSRSRSRSPSSGRRPDRDRSGRRQQRSSPVAPTSSSSVNTVAGERDRYRVRDASPPPSKSDAVGRSSTASKGAAEDPSGLASRLDKFRRLEQNLLDRVDARKAVFDRRPEDHPRYGDEWRRFWERRYKQVQAAGKNADTYDYTPEWKTYWEDFTEELFMRERHERRAELLDQYELTEVDGKVVDAADARRQQRHESQILGAGSSSPRRRHKSDTPPAFDTKPLPCNPSPPPPELAAASSSVERPDTGVSTMSAGSGTAAEAATSAAAPAAARPDLCSVLRVLTALEDQLGSFAGATNALMTRSIAAERQATGGSAALLHVTDNALLLETLREKLLGQITAGILSAAKTSASRQVADQIALLLQAVPRHVFAPRLSPQQLADRIAGTVTTSDPLVVSQLIAAQLTRFGMNDVTEQELGQVLVLVLKARGLFPSTPQPAAPRADLPPALPFPAEILPMASASTGLTSAPVPAVAITKTATRPVVAPLFNAYADKSATASHQQQPPPHALNILQSAYDEDGVEDEEEVHPAQTAFAPHRVTPAQQTAFAPRAAPAQQTRPHLPMATSAAFRPAMTSRLGAPPPRTFPVSGPAPPPRIHIRMPTHLPLGSTSVAKARRRTDDDSQLHINPSAPESDDELSAEQIHALLVNFDTLSRPEQEQLMEYLKKLEREQHDKVEQLKVLLAREPIKTMGVALGGKASTEQVKSSKDASSSGEARSSKAASQSSGSQQAVGGDNGQSLPASVGKVDLTMFSKEAIEAALHLAKQLQSGGSLTSPMQPSAVAKPSPPPSASPAETAAATVSKRLSAAASQPEPVPPPPVQPELPPPPPPLPPDDMDLDDDNEPAKHPESKEAPVPLPPDQSTSSATGYQQQPSEHFPSYTGTSWSSNAAPLDNVQQYPGAAWAGHAGPRFQGRHPDHHAGAVDPRGAPPNEYRAPGSSVEGLGGGYVPPSANEQQNPTPGLGRPPQGPTDPSWEAAGGPPSRHQFDPRTASGGPPPPSAQQTGNAWGSGEDDPSYPLSEQLDPAWVNQQGLNPNAHANVPPKILQDQWGHGVADTYNAPYRQQYEGSTVHGRGAAPRGGQDFGYRMPPGDRNGVHRGRGGGPAAQWGAHTGGSNGAGAPPQGQHPERAAAADGYEHYPYGEPEAVPPCGSEAGRGGAATSGGGRGYSRGGGDGYRPGFGEAAAHGYEPRGGARLPYDRRQDHGRDRPGADVGKRPPVEPTWDDYHDPGPQPAPSASKPAPQNTDEDYDPTEEYELYAQKYLNDDDDEDEYAGEGGAPSSHYMPPASAVRGGRAGYPRPYQQLPYRPPAPPLQQPGYGPAPSGPPRGGYQSYRGPMRGGARGMPQRGGPRGRPAPRPHF